MPFDWKSNYNPTVETGLIDVDIILGADVFYSSEDFDDVLRIVANIIRRSSKSQDVIFYTTYQERRLVLLLLSYSLNRVSDCAILEYILHVGQYILFYYFYL